MKRLALISKRKNKRISRVTLAETLGVSESTIEKVESGIRRASIRLAEEWAGALGIKVNEIWPIFFKCDADNMSGKADDQTSFSDPDPAA